jgi:hypothetical protein
MSKQMSRQPTKQERRRDRREEQRRRAEEQLRAGRMRRRVIIGAAIIAILLVVGISAYVFSVSKGAQGQASTTTSPDSSPVNTQMYPPVDNISCNSEQSAYHVHVHLSLYINGAAVPVPQNLGIAPDQSCFYWLHTHDTTGVIHVEAPKKDVFTLGTFFREWQEQFPQLQYPLQLDQTSGWTVYVNGKPYNGDFRKISLDAHALITMAYNTPGVTPDTQYNWGSL